MDFDTQVKLAIYNHFATTWYSTRLQAKPRCPQPYEMRGIFASPGLEGDFRDPASDSFR